MSIGSVAGGTTQNISGIFLITTSSVYAASTIGVELTKASLLSTQTISGVFTIYTNCKGPDNYGCFSSGVSFSDCQSNIVISGVFMVSASNEQKDGGTTVFGVKGEGYDLFKEDPEGIFGKLEISGVFTISASSGGDNSNNEASGVSLLNCTGDIEVSGIFTISDYSEGTTGLNDA
ncbi:hypothetical protein FACS1894218_5380 [Bacilli bacterium]|nr:hypothetical protein FACS1894218_5380 [Bacilli bacterium]